MNLMKRMSNRVLLGAMCLAAFLGFGLSEAHAAGPEYTLQESPAQRADGDRGYIGGIFKNLFHPCIRLEHQTELLRRQLAQCHLETA
jgi:hypothetical protein